MELTYDRGGASKAVGALVAGVLVLGLGLLLKVAGFSSSRTPIPFLVTGCALVFGGLMVLYLARRPFRFLIDERGLTLRLPGLRRLGPFVSWRDIDAVLVEPGPSGVERIVLVPADDTGIRLRPDTQTSIEGRPGIVLVRLAELVESEFEVRRALKQYAGLRYVE